MRVMREQLNWYCQGGGRTECDWAQTRNPSNGRTALVIFIADQTPSLRNVHYFTPLFNRPTAPLLGPNVPATKRYSCYLYGCPLRGEGVIRFSLSSQS